MLSRPSSTQTNREPGSDFVIERDCSHSTHPPRPRSPLHSLHPSLNALLAQGASAQGSGRVWAWPLDHPYVASKTSSLPRSLPRGLTSPLPQPYWGLVPRVIPPRRSPLHATRKFRSYTHHREQTSSPQLFPTPPHRCRGIREGARGPPTAADVLCVRRWINFQIFVPTEPTEPSARRRRRLSQGGRGGVPAHLALEHYHHVRGGESLGATVRLHLGLHRPDLRRATTRFSPPINP